MMDWSLWTNRKFLVMLELVALSVLLASFTFGQSKSVRNPDRARINSKGELTSNSIRRNKAKYHYDDGGLYQCNVLVFEILKKKNDDPCKEKQVRDFIWDHVNLKKRGYVRLVFSGVDAGAVEYLFVEPDKNGEWMVTWWSVDYSALPGPGRFKIYSKKLLTPERAETGENSTWKLILKDKGGLEALKIPHK